ncbi:MAG: hypothetical protein D6729_15145 [Deltaproteobacteria bacterium]|nr:MAG: hypothetical protein D6729_15145 [Deltaproteobacteria bacterium]
MRTPPAQPLAPPTRTGDRMRLGAVLVLALTGACGTLSPLEVIDEGICHGDGDCKGARVCREGRCVFPDDADGGRSDAGPDGWIDVDAGPDGGIDTVDAGPDGGWDGGRDGGPDAGSDGGTADGGGPPQPGEVGAACRSPRDCDHPRSVCIQRLPGGYCAIPGCPGGCPEGTECVDSDGMRLCLDGCSSDSDCRPQYMCRYDVGPGVCLPRVGGGTTEVGGPCQQPRDCAGEPAWCVQEWPDGYCVTFDCMMRGCAEGSSCYDLGNGDSACFRDCTVPADCQRPEYTCLVFAPNAPGVCLPRCDLVDLCDPGQTCDPATGLCR